MGDWYWSTSGGHTFKRTSWACFLYSPKNKNKKHILVLTLCSRSLSHTMKLTARHRQLIQREAISPAGGVWRRDRWLAVLNCNTSVQHVVIETLTLNSVKLSLLLLVSIFFVSPWFGETIKNELTLWYHRYRSVCVLSCVLQGDRCLSRSLFSLHITVKTRLDWKPWLAFTFEESENDEILFSF